MSGRLPDLRTASCRVEGDHADDRGHRPRLGPGRSIPFAVAIPSNRAQCFQSPRRHSAPTDSRRPVRSVDFGCSTASRPSNSRDLDCPPTSEQAARTPRTTGTDRFLKSPKDRYPSGTSIADSADGFVEPVDARHPAGASDADIAGCFVEPPIDDCHFGPSDSDTADPFVKSLDLRRPSSQTSLRFVDRVPSLSTRRPSCLPLKNPLVEKLMKREPQLATPASWPNLPDR